MLTPYSLVMAARIALAVVGPLAIGVACVAGPRDIIVEAVAFLTLSNVTAVLAILALPWNRRNDALKAVALVWIVLVVIRSGLTGEPAIFGTLPAAIAGVLTVWLTLEAERCRNMARTYGDVSFAVIRVESERRFRARRNAASRPKGDPAEPAPEAAEGA